MNLFYEDNEENLSLANTIAKIKSSKGKFSSVMVIRCFKSKKIIVCETGMIRNFEEKISEFFKGKKI